jgi:starch phosphorylase
MSILDGWWLEAYNGKNGWAIGGKADSDQSSQDIDRKDADSLYSVLLNEVLPDFFDRDANGIPVRWIARVRNAMRSIIPVYNTHRMVLEYRNKYYSPPR